MTTTTTGDVSSLLHKKYVPLSEKIYDIDCRIELQDWIITNECVSYEILNKITSGETFRDHDGVLRFVSNWFPAPEVDENVSIDAYVKYQQHFSLTGCFEIPLAVSKKLVSNCIHSDENIHVATIKILSNWERLWNNLAADTSDEIADQVPLLRACVSFFMHKATFLLFLSLFIYNESLTIWVSVELRVSPAIVVGLFIYNLSTLLLYFILFRLYNTNRSENSKNNDNHDDPPSLEFGYRKKLESIHIKTSTVKYVTNMHWSGSVRQLFALVKVEVRSLFNGTSSPKKGLPEISKADSNISPRREESLRSFDMLLNIALKYLTRHCEVRRDDLNLSRLGYRIAFLTIFTILPVVCLLQMTYSWFVTISYCQISSNYCRASIIYTALTVGYLTTGVYDFLLFGAQIISLIGLMYGSELAYRMIDCWMKRFASLRRVAFSDTEDVEASTLSQRLVSPVTALNRETNSLQVKEISYISMRDLSQQLTRDATEQYLFIVEYMRQSGSVWSSVIVGLYIYSITLTTMVAYIVIVYESQLNLSAVIQVITFIVAEILMYLVFPTWSVAHANSFLSPMLDLFTNSAKEDFGLIGTFKALFNKASEFHYFLCM